MRTGQLYARRNRKCRRQQKHSAIYVHKGVLRSLTRFVHMAQSWWRCLGKSNRNLFLSRFECVRGNSLLVERWRHLHSLIFFRDIWFSSPMLNYKWMDMEQTGKPADGFHWTNVEHTRQTHKTHRNVKATASVDFIRNRHTYPTGIVFRRRPFDEQPKNKIFIYLNSKILSDSEITVGDQIQINQLKNDDTAAVHLQRYV